MMGPWMPPSSSPTVTAASCTGASRPNGSSATRADEVVGQPVDVIVPDAYRDRHWDGFHRAMATGECRLDRAATNLPTLHRDGTERVLPARFVFLVDARGTPVGAMAIYAEPVGGEQAWGPVLDQPA